MAIHTYIFNMVSSSTIPGTGIIINIEITHSNNKQKHSSNFHLVPPDRRLFHMQEVIREISSEKDPVLGHMLDTGSADLFMGSYKLEKKKGRDKQDF